MIVFKIRQNKSKFTKAVGLLLPVLCSELFLCSGCRLIHYTKAKPICVWQTNASTTGLTVDGSDSIAEVQSEKIQKSAAIIQVVEQADYSPKVVVEESQTGADGKSANQLSEMVDQLTQATVVAPTLGVVEETVQWLEVFKRNVLLILIQTEFKANQAVAKASQAEADAKQIEADSKQVVEVLKSAIRSVANTGVRLETCVSQIVNLFKQKVELVKFNQLIVSTLKIRVRLELERAISLIEQEGEIAMIQAILETIIQIMRNAINIVENAKEAEKEASREAENVSKQVEITRTLVEKARILTEKLINAKNIV